MRFHDIMRHMYLERLPRGKPYIWGVRSRDIYGAWGGVKPALNS